MAEIREISDCFETLRDETLRSLGIEERSWRQTVAARLVIERIGEQEPNYWWDSQVLGSFGGDTLGEVVPQTATQTQISLATEIGGTVETEHIPAESAVSLFNLGPFVESRIEHVIESIEGDDDLSVLEPLSIEITEPGWTDALTNVDAVRDSNARTAIELGSIDMKTLRKKSTLNNVVSQLIAGYGAATKQELVVPYYTVNS